MKKIIFLIIFLITVQAEAQQVALYSQYMFGSYPYNPAVAGSDNRFVATLGYRNQWMGFEGAPVTGLFTLQGPLGSGSSNIGALVYHDQTGAMERLCAMPGYTYRVFLDKKTSLSFGLQAGIIQFVLNGDEMTTKESNDPAVPTVKSKALFGDASFGIYLKGEKYYFGMAVPQLLNGAVSLTSDFSRVQSGLLQRHLFAMGGLDLTVSDNFAIQPSVLLKATQAAPLQVDVNCKFLFHDMWWLGATYRSRAAVSFLAGLEISKMVFIGYAFDLSTNEISRVSNGSHEVFLGFKFKERRKSNQFFK